MTYLTTSIFPLGIISREPKKKAAVRNPSGGPKLRLQVLSINKVDMSMEMFSIISLSLGHSVTNNQVLGMILLFHLFSKTPAHPRS